MLQQFGPSTFPTCQQEARLYFESGTVVLCHAVLKILLAPLAPYHGPFCNPLRLQLGFARLLKTVSIWPVRSHHAVQAGPSRLEAFLLCFVVAFDEPHELTHAVPCRRHREEVAAQCDWEASQLGCELLETHKLSRARQWVEGRFLNRVSHERTLGILQVMLVKLYRFYSTLNYLDSETELPNEGALMLVDLPRCFSYHLELCKYYTCIWTAWCNLIFTDLD